MITFKNGELDIVVQTDSLIGLIGRHGNGRLFLIKEEIKSELMGDFIVIAKYYNQKECLSIHPKSYAQEVYKCKRVFVNKSQRPSSQDTGERYTTPVVASKRKRVQATSKSRTS